MFIFSNNKLIYPIENRNSFIYKSVTVVWISLPFPSSNPYQNLSWKTQIEKKRHFLEKKNVINRISGIKPPPPHCWVFSFLKSLVFRAYFANLTNLSNPCTYLLKFTYTLVFPLMECVPKKLHLVKFELCNCYISHLRSVDQCILIIYSTCYLLF